MKCIYVDTNVFLRFLTRDIPKQADKAEAYFKKAQKGELCISILHVTLVEILFHLERFYDVSRVEATEKVAFLIKPKWAEVEKKDAVLEALYTYQINKIDFVDVLTWSMAKSKKAHILSFDKDFDKLQPSIRIEP